MVYKPVAHYDHLTELESPKGRAQVSIFSRSPQVILMQPIQECGDPCSGDSDGGMIILITINH